MKRLIVLVSLVISLQLITGLKSVNAADVQTCTQVTQYGGAVGIVCGVHTPVETGLADINPVVLASIFFAFAGMGLKIYKKTLRAEVSI